MTDGIVVRPERDHDTAAIADVVRAAFNGDAEAELVEGIRASEHFIPELSLVAVDGERVVGHVMISYVFLEQEQDGDGGSLERRLIPSLSPLAVVPDLHGRGIGSALVRAVTAAADARGEGLVVLEGSPAYYGRFGFEPASAHGLHLEVPDWAPPRRHRCC